MSRCLPGGSPALPAACNTQFTLLLHKRHQPPLACSLSMLNKLSLEFVPAFVSIWFAEIVDAWIFAQRKERIADRVSVR